MTTSMAYLSSLGHTGQWGAPETTEDRICPPFQKTYIPTSKLPHCLVNNKNVVTNKAA